MSGIFDGFAKFPLIMEAEIMQNNFIIFETPDSAIQNPEDHSNLNYDQGSMPRSISPDSTSGKIKSQDSQKLSTPQYIAGGSIKSPKMEEGFTGSMVRLTRTARRRSILESTMMDQSGTDTLISTSDHAISSVLNDNITDFVKMIKVIADREDSLTENVVEINPMQHFLAHAKKIADVKPSAAHSSRGSASRTNTISIKGLKEDLDFALGLIKTDHGKNTSQLQKVCNSKIVKIIKERQEKLKYLAEFKDGIHAAQKRALDEGNKRDEEAMKGFSLKIEKPMLPKVALALNHIPFKTYKMVTDPPLDVVAEEVPLDQKMKILIDKIKMVEINRTDSGIKKRWLQDDNMNIIDIEKQGILEIDANSVSVSNGALEVPKHVSVSSCITYSPEELKILLRMNSRKTYLKNPRYCVLPKITSAFDSQSGNLNRFITYQKKLRYTLL